jgi:hypothetical protein
MVYITRNNQEELMKKDLNIKKPMNVKDVSCKDCIKRKDAFGLYDGGLCTRLCMDCAEARPICVKTGWYAEMCTANAIMDAVL